MINVIEDDCYFLGCTSKAIINLRPNKICFTLGLFANYSSLKSLLPSYK